MGMTSQRTRDRLIERLREQGIRNESVLEVMRSTPRHIFIEEALASRAYEDTALPIGQGQTISQPYIVARMTEALLGEGELPRKVLEVGTGSGYQTAILARLVEQVYSVERIDALMQQARTRFQELGLRNIRLKHSDGNWGWDDYGPYDGIIVTAAPPQVPKPLYDQLSVGGRLVIPVGEQGRQQLLVVTRTHDGYDSKTIDLVSFVPLRGGLG
ncbi:protein-L-isoaspartate(D-aspartate) O-methyltransferase [Sulfuriflexus mobilis]|uniref:protein-L-isoaspartate(D-aspartate) O-methyltransferase n=1 Tax=Sulfuriflexus mobilis TaxID=1811807 RepID=UPI0018D50E97|nr:protein-L-isoaspartate(D-aspartate) O-methyltransferase [Sulfuriflexus mobilis]